MKEKFFELPFLFERFEIGKKVIELQKSKPFIFKDGVIVNALYGSNGGKLNGGRYMNVFCQNEEEVSRFVYENNVTPIVIMSNLLIQEKEIPDKQATKILENFNKSSTMFCVANKNVEKWLEKNFVTRGQFVLSTTACFDADELSKNTDMYKRMVLSESLVNNWQKLMAMKERTRNKLIICVNSCCPIDCEARYIHYKHISELNIKHNASRENEFYCAHKDYGGRAYLFEIMKCPQFVTNEMIDVYVNMGINHFKIRGRGDRIADLIETMSYFLIRDEYQLMFREECYDVAMI